MRLRNRLPSVVVAGGVALTGLALAPTSHVLAGSGATQYCFDNPLINPNGDDIPILTGQGGLWLAVEIGGSPTTLGPGNVGHVSVCASSTAPGSTSPETVGEAFTVDALATGWGDPSLLNVRCIPDPNAVGPLNPACQVQALQPTYQLNQGLSGVTISVSIPYTVCPGPCTAQTIGLGQTGVIVGVIQPSPTGIGYQLVGTQVWVDGVQVISSASPIGAFADPSAVGVGAVPGAGAPCVLGVCSPAFYVLLKSQPIVGVQIPGLPPLTVTSPITGCPVNDPATYCG